MHAAFSSFPLRTARTLAWLLRLWPAWTVLAPPAPAAESGPVVAVATATRQDLAKDLSVQAELRPYQEIELHSKIAGYVREIRVEVGDHVKQGDLLAVLEVPELRGDLARAEATLKRAEANAKEASQNYTRLAGVNRSQPNLVAQSDVDLAQAKDHAAAAAVAEAKADLEKARAMEGYTRIVAPFDGVITRRYTDPGALIQAGTSSNTQALPLVRLSQDTKLRLVFPVSVSYARQLQVGDPLQVVLGARETPLPGRIARFNRRISTETRTMLGEMDVPNPDGKLIPGMYVTAILQLEQRPGALSVPVEAVSGTSRPTVYVVNGDGRIEERVIQLGIQTPTRYEVLAGLKEGERVMIGSRAQVQVGQAVTAKALDQASQ